MSFHNVSRKSVNHCLWILMHGVILLPDAMSCDKFDFSVMKDSMNLIGTVSTALYQY